MILTLTLIALFSIAAVATGLSLLDSWVLGRDTYASLKREQELLEAGFLPQVQSYHVRLRKPARRTVASATRPYARRLPLPVVKTAA